MLRSSVVILTAGALLVASSCRRDMQDQPKYKPLRESRYFADGRASRPTPLGTIARDELDADDPLHSGSSDNGFLQNIPMPVTVSFLHRGQDRFNIFCSPCHSRTGDGDGMVHRRGFWVPPNLHSARARSLSPGYLFQVISNGYGAMPSYKEQIVETRDIWAIVAYVRALQLSRNATIGDVPTSLRHELETNGAAPERGLNR
ncbi:MAG: c-type cytochrome [Bryobacteraceae bacterium]